MASASANDIIQDAMIEAKIISPGESVPSSKVAQVFRKLNGMLESWALDRLMVYASTIEEFSMVSGQAEYTWGTGGDFDSDRPIRPEIDAYVTIDSTDYPVIEKDLSVYRGLAVKGVQSRPKIWSYNPEFPLFRLFFWPTPDYAYTLNIRSWKQLTEFDDRTTSVTLPKGYWRAIVFGLAIEISSSFGKNVSAELAALAGDAISKIKKSNVTPIGIRRSDVSVLTGPNRSSYFQSGPFI